jgi:serine phosphatase RsbU (regulator of sigma subunit)
VEWSSAGHLPPLLASGSDATYLSVTPGRPLGAPSDASEVVGPSLAMPMRAGDVVVLYTDGVVERRDAGLDTGLARLRDIVAAHATAEPQAVADEIVRTMCQPHDDDCSILVLRRDAD